MIEIRYLQNEDKAFWFELDRHLPEQEYDKKVRDQRGYVLSEDNNPVGILRYNLFWDSIPFCTMVFVDERSQKKGYGKELVLNWEKDMKAEGYGMVMTSTQVNENAQHFYRKLGYQDAGALVLNVPGYEQPMEMFLVKTLYQEKNDNISCKEKEKMGRI